MIRRFIGYRREQYGEVERFRTGAKTNEILDQMPKKLKKLIKKARKGAKNLGEINMDSFTIIFKTANMVGGPLETSAVLAIKMDVLIPEHCTEGAER